MPVDDPPALAAAANRLLTEPGLRDRLAAAAPRGPPEFDQRVMAERSLAIYRHVLGRPVPLDGPLGWAEDHLAPVSSAPKLPPR